MSRLQLSDKQHKINVLREVKNEVHTGNVSRSLELLRAVADPSDDLSLQTKYSRLALELTKGLSEFPIIKIAFLANVTLHHWVDCLRFWLLLEGFRLEATIIPYGTWRQQVLDETSALYRIYPDVVWFFTHVHDLGLDAGQLLDSNNVAKAVSHAVEDVTHQISVVANRLPALFIVNNVVAPADRIFGNFEGSTPASPSAFISRFNLELAASLPSGSTVFDLAHLAAKFGLDRWEDSRLWYHSKHPFSLDAQGSVAFAAARLLAAAKGRARKCVILDLDNTLWGGVIGDDGIGGIRVGPDGGAVGEAYAHFQAWIKALADRGIALAVCSKNNEDLAREPFLKKSGMVLQLGDFAAFKANWENKADNIRAIAEELNLGLDSFVFIDDNPAERALVRLELPQVNVPELPPDPADYIRSLSAGRWFETLAVSEEDRIRSRAYRENNARTQAQHSATDLNTYLRSLEMFAKWDQVSPATLQRVTQLINKTNQFHLTTTRYTESQISAMAASPETWVGHFSLSDRFGNYGLIAVAILRFEDEQAVIDTWAMSCRVFSRGMEDFIFKRLWQVAKERNCKYLIGKYKPSSRNAVVAELYQNFGGIRVGEENIQEGGWSFDLAMPEPTSPTVINDISDQRQLYFTSQRD